MRFVLLALSVAITLLWLVHGWGYLEDDAWIHLEFARSVASGQGFAFNGRIVYGDTSPLWVWLLCAAHAVIPRWETAAKILDLCGALFALFAIDRFARALTRTLPTEQSELFAAVATLVVVTGPYFGYWSFSGMEAVTACGLAAFACALLTDSAMSPAAFLTAAFCAGLAPLLRPEMAFLSLLIGLVLLVRIPRQHRALLFFAGLVLIVVPFALWARYAVHTFGSILPTTNAAKRAGPTDSVAAKLVSIATFGFPEAILGAAAVALASLVALAQGRIAAVRSFYSRLGTGALVLFAWIAIAITFYIVDHTYVQTRYIMVYAPLLAIAMLAAAALAAPRLYPIATVLTLACGILLSARVTWTLVHNKVVQNGVLSQLASFVHTMPADQPVAAYAIGQIAFQSEHTIIDTGGITRPGIIPYMWDSTSDRSHAWMRSQGAAYIVGVKPGPGATLIWTHPTAPVGWLIRRGGYSAHEDLELWTLPPGPSDPTKLPAR